MVDDDGMCQRFRFGMVMMMMMMMVLVQDQSTHCYIVPSIVLQDKVRIRSVCEVIGGHFLTLDEHLICGIQEDSAEWSGSAREELELALEICACLKDSWQFQVCS